MEFINSQSYELEFLARSLGYEYTSHLPIDDAIASGVLFEYLKRNYEIDSKYINSFIQEGMTNNDIDERLVANLNSLSGIIQGITADGVVTDKEIARLRRWIEENEVNRQYPLFDKIISELMQILEDNVVDEYEQVKLRYLVKEYSSSKIYSEISLGIQVLHGIIDGIVCDDTILESEVIKLTRWLYEHDYLSGVYPYNIIMELIQKVIDDRVIDEQEKNMLLREFNNIIGLSEDNSCKINNTKLDGKIFCLSGEFTDMTKSEVSRKLQEMGAIEEKGVSPRLDYLFVGGEKSVFWKFGIVGGKMAKALELQEMGNKIQIISEENMKDLMLS